MSPNLCSPTTNIFSLLAATRLAGQKRDVTGPVAEHSAMVAGCRAIQSRPVAQEWAVLRSRRCEPLVALALVLRLATCEVVQLYIRDKVGSIVRPLKELKGFEKIFLTSGESRTVEFIITPDDLMFYNYDLDYVWEPGEFEIMIGGSSADVQRKTVTWNK